MFINIYLYILCKNKIDNYENINLLCYIHFHFVCMCVKIFYISFQFHKNLDPYVFVFCYKFFFNIKEEYLRMYIHKYRICLNINYGFLWQNIDIKMGVQLIFGVDTLLILTNFKISMETPDRFFFSLIPLLHLSDCM